MIFDHVQMYRSADSSEILERMTFVQNGVDIVRRNTTIIIDKTNNGGSFVELENVKSYDKNSR